MNFLFYNVLNVPPRSSENERGELDRAVHVQTQRDPLHINHRPKNYNRIMCDTQLPSDQEVVYKHSIKSLSPGERYELWKFEQKYQTLVNTTDYHDASDLIDNIYHDDVVHMMDGVAHDKSALKKLFIHVLKQGASRTIKKFNVIDSTHIETVIHTRIEHMEFYGRHMMTLKGGKIIRVEKIESADLALPPPVQKFAHATAA